MTIINVFYFCLFTQTDQAMPIVMKKREVFQGVQQFLKKTGQYFHGAQSYN